ncbi:MAG TPA: hypothetical protein VF594_08990, partial [Rubricoccaceae bacterium]
MPRTLTVEADSTLAPVLTAGVTEFMTDHPGITVRLAPDAPDADLIVEFAPRSGSRALARASFVLVGAPGREPSPTLASALEGAASVGVASGSTSEQTAKRLMRAAGVKVSVVQFATVKDALDAVASRETPLAFALAPE